MAKGNADQDMGRPDGVKDGSIPSTWMTSASSAIAQDYAGQPPAAA